MNSTIGQILLWAGFLSGALATVFSTATWSRLDLTVQDQPFVVISELSETEQKKAAEGNSDATLPQLPLPLNARLMTAGDKEIKTLDDLKEEVTFPLTVTYREVLETRPDATETSEPNPKPILRWPGPDKKVTLETSDRQNLVELLGTLAKPEQKTELTVGEIDYESSGWNVGLREGSVITAIGSATPTNSNDFNKALGGVETEAKGKKSGDGLPEEDSIRIVNIKFLDSNGSKKDSWISIYNEWKTINWFWYALSALICVVGIVMIQISRKSNAGQSEKTQSNLQEIKGNLDSLVTKTQTLNNEVKNYKPRQILTYIEDKLADDFRDFADGRDSITAEHGLEVFAQVMTQFAAGERSINRAWSASADGYIEEAATCIQRGLKMLETAQELLNRA